MTQKILARASGQLSVLPGDAVLPRVALVTCPDGQTFIDRFNERDLKVWDPTRLIFCFDHMLQPDYMAVRAVVEHPRILRFAERQGIPAENVYQLGRNGISHQIPVEHGWALPGTVCVGLDTQSATMGAANCFALPALYGVDPILITGDVWLIAPECTRLTLRGRLRHGVTGKDIVYHLIRSLPAAFRGRVMEIDGPGIASLPMDLRLAVANGAVQIGVMTVVFAADAVLANYLAGRAREPFEPVAADPDASYAAEYVLDLAEVEPLVAGPHEIERIRPVSAVEGQPVNAAYIGSCSSGRLSDLALAAEVLRGRRVDPGVRLVVTPISAETHREAARSGVLQDLLDAGATVTQPGCGACYSCNLSPLKLADGERCISTSVETLRGRMGSAEAEILLANAAVVAASAIEGRIADPVLYLQPVAEPAA